MTPNRKETLYLRALPTGSQAAQSPILKKALEFYADNYIDGGSKARMALADFERAMVDEQKTAAKD
jgi:hypothetical protein